MTRRIPAPVIVAVVLIASACGTQTAISGDDGDARHAGTDLAPTIVTPEPDPALYDPVAAGEPLPDDYLPLAPRDAIFPVYEPRFVKAEKSMWSDDILVVGVDLEGEARAYPVGFLNAREMVIDLHRGIPTLVTW